jgi:drug/metabolite transporter (DMT)-like permease
MTENTKGILLVIAALSLAAFSGAIMKLLGEQLSAFQVAWFRFTGMGLMLLPYLLHRYGVTGLKPARPLVQIVRGLTMAGGTTAFVLGIKTVDYADAIAILYAYPFVLVILAVLFLDERAGPSVWIGVGCGFAGVLLVMRPEFERFDSGNLFIFASAVIVGIQLTLNRKLSLASPPLVTAFAGAVCASLSLTLLLPGSWSPIPGETWWLITLLVISGGINQTMLVFAFAHADASTLAPFTYSEIVSAVVFGFLFFGTLPSLLSWCGILLITAGGIYVARALHLQNVSRRVPKV